MLRAMGKHALRLALALCLASSVARADPPTKAQVEEAQGHFFKGVDFYNDADFPNAIVEFKKAYDTAPDFHVLFNVGQACYQAQNYACALDAFARYLDDGGTHVPAKRRADVEKDVKKLQARVGKVEISVSVEGATVAVDDEKIGTTPLPGPVPLSQGKRKITITKPGYEPLSDAFDVAGGETKQVGFTMKETPKAPPPPPPPPKVAHRSPLPFVAAGVTGALVVGAVVTGVVALSASGDADHKLGTLGSSPQDIKNAESQASTFALVTDILGGAAIVGAAATVVLFVVLGKTPKDSKPAALVPVLGPGAVGVAGRF